MPYGLAKELKDAGFPQRKTRNVYDETGALFYIPDKNVEGYTDCPTLEELIEACVDKTRKLGGFLLAGHGQGDWNATAYGRIGEGPTPLIAVAKLWLALNKTV